MKLLLLLLTLTSINAHADNHMMIIGGGGEPVGETTIFDSTIEELGDTVKDSDWNYTVSFDSGHAKTEALVARSFPKDANKPFTAANYNKMIEDYKAKVLSGEFKAGDQLMIVLDTHGASNEKSAFNKVKSHQVSTVGGAASDLNNLSGSSLVDLDNLQSLMDLTNQKGIKLAVVDLSCHSGNTLALKSPNTCVISASGPNHFGFASNETFGAQFLKGLKKGKNLEETFLKARSKANEPAYPMISTEMSESIFSDFYKDITPYLYYYSPDGNTDKLNRYVKKLSSDKAICQREEEFKKLKENIEKLQSAVGKSYDSKKLISLLDQYKKDQDFVIDAFAKIGGTKLGQKEKISGIAPLGKSFVTVEHEYDWATIVSSNPDSTISYFQEQMNATTYPEKKASSLANINLWKRLKERKAEILAQYPELDKYADVTKAAFEKIKANYETTSAIAQEERKLYNEAYKLKQATSTAPNPCKEIVF